MKKLSELLKDSAYKLTQFSNAQIEALENRIIDKEVRGQLTPYVKCLVRKQDIKLTPEEVVRQLFIDTLNQKYGYPFERMKCEWIVTQGSDSTSKRADIVIFDADRPTEPYIIVEVKKSNSKEGIEQLKSYCNWANAPIGVWTNGVEVECFFKNANLKSNSTFLDKLTHLPHSNQTLADVLNERFTIKDLIKSDELQAKSLRSVILDFENIVLANSGVDAFEEIFKLIFTKLFDEFQSGSDKDEINALLKHGAKLEDIKDDDFRALEFRNSGTDTDVKNRLEKLFEGARKKWKGIFPEQSNFDLTPSHLNSCVSYLQNIKLFNSNLDVVDDAFEYLINKSSKGEKGQYFTPRYVIDMCVKMLNPKAHETLIDTAAGSCGFPMHSIFHVWQALNPDSTNLFTTDKRTNEQIAYVQNNVFALDLDARVVRIGRTLNLIAGDGQTSVLELNTLDYKNWREVTTQSKWNKIYGNGFERLKELRQKGCDENDFSAFEFDVLMANPPFAGNLTKQMMSTYDNYALSKNATGKTQAKVGRDILFIERNLNFLKAGGRMAVVLPQGRFNNSSDKYIREFIAQHCRILAVVGLHGNVFKPHTGTKTSVLLVQKWDETLCPKVDDYPIFFATMQEPSKDNSGEKIYLKDENGLLLKDNHGHFIVQHDLFNHDGLTQDGIAEAFMEFAKKENLSFFDSSSFNEVKYRAALEGLEISEVTLSYVLNKNDIFRFDSNYFQKRFLLDELVIRNKEYTTLKNTGLDIRSFGAYSLNNEVTYLDKGIPFIRGVNMKKGRISFSDMIFIDERANSLLWKSEVKPEMILLSMSGTIGDVAIASKNWHYPMNSNQDIAKIDTLGKINAYFLYAFLMTEFGQNYLKREARGSVQQHVFLSQIEQFEVPIFSENFDNAIQNVIEQSDDLFARSESSYSQAETLLLNTLGMADFSPSTENINVKSFKDSFLTTGRLDAEYYQPKYEEMMAHITNQSHAKLTDFVTIQKSVETGSDAYSEDENGLPYLRVADYNKFGITPPQKKLTDSFVADNFEKLKNLKPKVGTILFSKDGSVGEAYCLQQDADFITSGAVLHLMVKNEAVLPDYLTLALNSELVKMQSERDAGGSIILHWRVSEIENVIVPVVDIKTQNQIADLVQRSFALKKESEMLLDKAKRAVEMAIETDELTAMQFIAGENNGIHKSI